MWHTWHDLHEDRVREIARDMQIANAAISITPTPKPHIGWVFRWFTSRFTNRRLQSTNALPPPIRLAK